MKLKSLLLLCLLISNLAYTQVYKIKATDFSFMFQNANGSWSNWSAWEKCNILCTIDISKDRIIIYSQETQIYDIIENFGTEYDEEGDLVWYLVGIDNEGIQCGIRIIKKPSGTQQLYVDYNDIRWAYTVYSLD